VAVADAAAPRAQRLLGLLLTAVVLGVMTVALNISLAAIIYQGEIATFADRGIALTLLGAAPMAVVGAYVLSYRGTVCQPQDTPAIVLSLAAAGIASGMPDPTSERSFATIAALVILATAASGLAAWLLGRFRLGFVARFIPFPVLAGFLAATGYLLVMAALGMVLGARVDIWTLPVLLEPGNPLKWLPWAATGIAISLLMQRVRSQFVLPISILAATAGFYLVIRLLGMDLDDARARGLLMGPFSGGGFLDALGGWQPRQVDWWAIAAQTPSILTIIGLTAAGALLSATALEVAVHGQIDPDRDLRGIGLCNLASAAGGGTIGYHVISDTLLAHRMGSDGPANGLIAGAACLVALVFGGGAIALLPVGIFSLLVIAIGTGMLLGVLLDDRRSLSAADYAVALIILAVTAAFGFLWGVAVGLLAAALFFIVAFARIDVVRLETTGARMRSRVERSEADQARLAALGGQVLVHVLAGYLFFGTAHRLVNRVRAALTREPPPRFVLIDFRRVRGIDTSAARALVRLHDACRADGVALWLTGLDPASARLVRGQAAAIGSGLQLAESLEDALERVEAVLLAEAPAADAARSLIDAFRDRYPDSELARYVEAFSVPAGAEVIAQGAPSDFLLMLRSGFLRTEVAVPGAAPMTVARCLPGALVGEIGLYAGIPRTARVVAEAPSEVLRIDAAALARMARDHPAMLADFHRLIAAILARRLSRTTALLADSENQAG
jgi:SulP family sulfate permease